MSPSTRRREHSPGTSGGNLGPVLVVGATGFLGRATVRALSQAGYEVRGLVRDGRKASRVVEDGGTPVLGDVLDVPSLRPAASGCWGLVHLAANPPEGQDPARVRFEGGRNLIEVARGAGVRRLLLGSGYWVYAGRSEPIREDSPVDPQGESRINYDCEQVGLGSNDPGRLEVLIARPAMVYGNGSWFRGMAEGIRRRQYRVVGTGANRWSFVDVEDAGAAFRSLLESGGAGLVYNVADERPETLRTLVDSIAREVGVPSPGSLSIDDAALEMGPAIAHHLSADRPMSAQRLRDLGWRPRSPGILSRLPGVLREMFPAGAEAPGSPGRS